MISDVISLPVNPQALRLELGTKLILDIFDLAIKMSKDLPKSIIFTNKITLQHRALNFIISAFASPFEWLSVSEPLMLQQLMDSYMRTIELLNSLEITKVTLADDAKKRKIQTSLEFNKLVKRTHQAISIDLRDGPDHHECSFMHKIELATVLVRNQFEKLLV